jgi:hypothetical protein
VGRCIGKRSADRFSHANRLAHDGTAGARKGAFFIKDMSRYRRSARLRTGGTAGSSGAICSPEIQHFDDVAADAQLELPPPPRIGFAEE